MSARIHLVRKKFFSFVRLVQRRNEIVNFNHAFSCIFLFAATAYCTSHSSSFRFSIPSLPLSAVLYDSSFNFDPFTTPLAAATFWVPRQKLYEIMKQIFHRLARPHFFFFGLNLVGFCCQLFNRVSTRAKGGKQNRRPKVRERKILRAFFYHHAGNCWLLGGDFVFSTRSLI